MSARGLHPAEGTANIWEDWKIGRGAERKAEELSVRKGLSSTAQLTSKETPKVAKRCESFRVPAFKLLLTIHIIPTASFLNRNKFAVQTPGRERDFQYP